MANYLKWFDSYLENKAKRVVLPGAESGWNVTHAGSNDICPRSSFISSLH